MLLDLSDLLSGNCRQKDFDARLEMNEFNSSLGCYRIEEKPDFTIKISATDNRKFLITCEGYVVMDIPCGRCLTDVRTKVPFEIERELDFDENDDETDERLEEMTYIDGYHLDVDMLVYSELLLNIPFRVLCREDCKGLCFKCGADLNKGECGCDREQLDPRMSVIQDIFKNFKEV